MKAAFFLIDHETPLHSSLLERSILYFLSWKHFKRLNGWRLVAKEIAWGEAAIQQFQKEVVLSTQSKTEFDGKQSDSSITTTITSSSITKNDLDRTTTTTIDSSFSSSKTHSNPNINSLLSINDDEKDIHQIQKEQREQAIEQKREKEKQLSKRKQRQQSKFITNTFL